MSSEEVVVTPRRFAVARGYAPSVLEVPEIGLVLSQEIEDMKAAVYDRVSDEAAVLGAFVPRVEITIRVEASAWPLPADVEDTPANRAWLDRAAGQILYSPAPFRVDLAALTDGV